jgi:zinc transport system ATP-binding protein
MNGHHDPAVSFLNVTVRLGGVSILEDVTARVPRGSCTAVIGPNGAGKTTLLSAMLGEVPFRGIIRTAWDEGGGAKIGYVPQHLSFDRDMPVTVDEFLVMGLQKMPLWLGIRKGLKAQNRALLSAVEAVHLGERRLGALSGGELQRILLALALQQAPDVLILDEPAAGMDVHGEKLICELLDGLRKTQGFTQLMVSHDLAMVSHHATHVICLNRKVIVEGPPRETLTDVNMAAVFGAHRGTAAPQPSYRSAGGFPDPHAQEDCHA